MRVLFVSPYPPARDGIGSYTSELAGATRAGGHDVAVVVPAPRPGSPPDVLGGLGWRPRELASLRAEVTAWRPDVVHLQFAVGAYGGRTPLLARWLAALRRDPPAPLVVTMHEVTRDTALLRGAGRALYRRLASWSDHVVVHTETAQRALAAMGVPPRQVSVVPHPAARPPAAAATPEELRERFGLGTARILLAFGFIHVDKGLGDLVRALGLARRQAPAELAGVRLVVAGAVRPRRGLFRLFEARDRLHFARVMRYARARQLRPHILLTGYVPDADVAAWFGAADAAVLPYRRIDQSGVAGLASAFGVPVLASSVGGLAEQFAGSPWVFPPRDPARLAQIMTDFLAVPAPRREPAATRPAGPDLAGFAASMLAVYRAVTPPTGAPGHPPATVPTPAGAVPRPAAAAPADASLAEGFPGGR